MSGLKKKTVMSGNKDTVTTLQNRLWCRPPAALRGFRIYTRSARQIFARKADQGPVSVLRSYKAAISKGKFYGIVLAATVDFSKMF